MSSQRRRLVIVEGSPLHRGLQIAGAAIVVIAIWSGPYVLEPFRLSQITQACVYATVIVGLNLLSGFGGQISPWSSTADGSSRMSRRVSWDRARAMLTICWAAGESRPTDRPAGISP